MSFSKDTKTELAHVVLNKECCKLAEIAGFIRVCGSIGLEGFGQFFITMPTDNPAVARHYKKLIKEYFDVDAPIEIGFYGNIKRGKKKYILRLGHNENSEAILRETGLLMIKGGMNYFTDGIYDELIKTKCCRKSYLRGAFLGGGTLSDPVKSHHFEIVCGSEELAVDIRRLMRTFNDRKFTEITPKLTERKERTGVYLKDRNQIKDVLAIMEANDQAEYYTNLIEQKNQKNKVTRAMNCELANVDKAVASAQAQVAAIKKIEEEMGLKSLKPELQEVAILRLNHPDAQLKDLCEMLDPPISKSGLSKRFKKIEEIAEKF